MGIVVTLKVFASCLIAAICSVPRDKKGDASARLRRASVRSCAATVAASIGDVFVMDAAWGKNLTDW